MSKVGTEDIFRSSGHKDRSALAAYAGAFNVPLKCSPEETKHFVEPAMKEAETSNFAGALEVVNDGLNAHPASEGLLFLRSYFCYKIADSISSELSTLPRPIQPLGEGVLMVDGAMTNQMLGRFQEIVKVLGDAEEAINEILQVNPRNNEVIAFRSYIDSKLDKVLVYPANVSSSGHDLLTEIASFGEADRLFVSSF